MTQVTRTDALPAGLDDLLVLALEEEFTALETLVRDFEAGTNRFDADREALFLAHRDGRLAGIGGLNVDPFETGGRAGRIGRVRRLFVAPAARRSGVGTSLMAAIIERARGRFDALHLRTYEPHADAFYHAIGFVRLAGHAHSTHAMSL